MRAGLRRRLATGANAVIVALLVVAITGLAVELAGQWRVRWDLSADRAASLQPQTRDVLERVQQPDAPLIQITAFSAQKRDEEAWYRDRSVRDLLEALVRDAPRLQARFVDFDADRITAERLGVERYGTVVVQAGDQRVDLIDRELFRVRGRGEARDIAFQGEAAVARALQQVLTGETPVVYTLYGHGERRIFDRGIGELRELSGRLHQQGWRSDVLDLLRDRRDGQAPVVPGDAAAVLVVGPRAPLAPVEEEALREYVARGGRVGIFVDPSGFAPDLLARVGVAVPEGLVLDPVSVYPHLDRPLLRYRSHPITAPLQRERIPTVVARAAPVEVTPMEGVEAAPLLVTSPRGWLERGDAHPPVYDPGVDVEGPHTVAAALTLRPPHPLAGGRVLVVGDSDVLGDELLSEGPGNTTFAVNSLRWLMEREALGGPSEPAGRVRRLALSPVRLAVIRWGIVGGVPAATLLMGAGVWWYRRRR